MKQMHLTILLIPHSFNLNSPETTVFIVFKITGIVSGDQEIVNSLIPIAS